MNKNTILAALSTLAPCDVLAGAAWLAAPQYSKGFHLVNNLDERSMELVSAQGNQEGVPPIGSRISDGQTQYFEVEYRVADTGRAFATYQINDPNLGCLGAVELELSYNWDGTTSVIVLGNSTNLDLIVSNPSDTTYLIQEGGNNTDTIIHPATAAACP